MSVCVGLTSWSMEGEEGFIDLNYASSIVVRSQLQLVSLWTPAATLYCWEYFVM